MAKRGWLAKKAAFIAFIMVCVSQHVAAWHEERTLWFETVIGGSIIRITDEHGNNPFHHEFITTDFDISELRAQGYTHFHISVDFEVQEIDDGWVDVEIWLGHSLTGTRVGPRGRFDPPANRNWVRFAHSVTVPLPVYNNLFTIRWSADGWGRDDYHLRERWIIVTPMRN